VWWRTPLIPAYRRLRQEDFEFQASLAYGARPSLTKPRHTHKGHDAAL
jgi:hypothetical protein